MRKEPLPQTPLAASHWFSLFISYEQRAGILLILATFLSLVISQTAFAGRYMACWAYSPGIYSLATWIQEVGMSFFFLLVGLELRREFGQGEWQDKRMALFPLSAALGGMLLPAVLYLGCCRHTSLQLGFGIPMATDIAFTLGIASLLGKRVPVSLKIFLTASLNLIKYHQMIELLEL